MHDAVIGNDVECEPFVLMNESGFGRAKTMSREDSPPDAPGQPPGKAPKILIGHPFPGGYVCTKASGPFSYTLSPGLQSGVSHDAAGDVSAKTVNAPSIPLWKCRPYPTPTTPLIARLPIP